MKIVRQIYIQMTEKPALWAIQQIKSFSKIPFAPTIRGPVAKEPETRRALTGNAFTTKKATRGLWEVEGWVENIYDVYIILQREG